MHHATVAMYAIAGTVTVGCNVSSRGLSEGHSEDTGSTMSSQASTANDEVSTSPSGRTEGTASTTSDEVSTSSSGHSESDASSPDSTPSIQVYGDGLGAGWSVNKWDSEFDLSSPEPVHCGSVALAVSISEAWGGVRLGADRILTGAHFSAVYFWIHGGDAGGQELQFAVTRPEPEKWRFWPITAEAGTWTPVMVTLAALGNPETFDGLAWQDDDKSGQPTFYVDDVTLIAASDALADGECP